MEEGRVALLDHHQIRELKLVVVNLTIDYRAEMKFGQAVSVSSRVTKVGRTSITVAQSLKQGRTVCASGSTILCNIDVVSGMPSPISEDLRALL